METALFKGREGVCISLTRRGPCSFHTGRNYCQNRRPFSENSSIYVMKNLPGISTPARPYSIPRGGAPLGIMGDHQGPPCNLIEHHDNMVLRGFRRICNGTPNMPREGMKNSSFSCWIKLILQLDIFRGHILFRK